MIAPDVVGTMEDFAQPLDAQASSEPVNVRSAGADVPPSDVRSVVAEDPPFDGVRIVVEIPDARLVELSGVLPHAEIPGAVGARFVALSSARVVYVPDAAEPAARPDPHLEARMLEVHDARDFPGARVILELPGALIPVRFDKARDMQRVQLSNAAFKLEESHLLQLPLSRPFLEFANPQALESAVAQTTTGDPLVAPVFLALPSLNPEDRRAEHERAEHEWAEHERAHDERADDEPAAEGPRVVRRHLPGAEVRLHLPGAEVRLRGRRTGSLQRALLDADVELTFGGARVLEDGQRATRHDLYALKPKSFFAMLTLHGLCVALVIALVAVHAICVLHSDVTCAAIANVTSDAHPSPPAWFQAGALAASLVTFFASSTLAIATYVASLPCCTAPSLPCCAPRRDYFCGILPYKNKLLRGAATIFAAISAMYFSQAYPPSCLCNPALVQAVYALNFATIPAYLCSCAFEHCVDRYLDRRRWT
jgi:hypothetical protein